MIHLTKLYFQAKEEVMSTYDVTNLKSLSTTMEQLWSRSSLSSPEVCPLWLPCRWMATTSSSSESPTTPSQDLSTSASLSCDEVGESSIITSWTSLFSMTTISRINHLNFDRLILKNVNGKMAVIKCYLKMSLLSIGRGFRSKFRMDRRNKYWAMEEFIMRN